MAKITKGYLKNMDTGSIKKFQYNPTHFQHGKNATYVNIEAVGMHHPIIAFVKGEAEEFPMEIYMYDNPYTGKIASFEKFILNLMPKDRNPSVFTKPASVIVAYGRTVKKCVVTGYTVDETMHDRKLNVMEATFTINFKTIGG